MIRKTLLFTSTRFQRSGHDIYIEFQVSADVLQRINCGSRPKDDRREQILHADGYRHGHGFIADSIPATVPVGVNDPGRLHSRLPYRCTQPKHPEVSTAATANVMIGRVILSTFMWSVILIQLHSRPSCIPVSRVRHAALVFNRRYCHQASWPRTDRSMSRIGQY